MRSFCIFLCLFLSALFVSVLTYTEEEDLLIKQYITTVTQLSSPKTLPPSGGNNPVKVQVGYKMTAVTDVNRNGYVETTGHLGMEWSDLRLKFGKVDRRLRQNNITEIQIDPSAIWIPDIQLVNSGNSRLEILNHGPGLNAVVFEKGYVVYKPMVTIRSLCDVMGQMQLGYLNCTLKFLSWSRHGRLLDVQAGEPDLGYFSVTGPWNVTDFTVQRNNVVYDCCPETPFPDVTFHFTVRGRMYYPV